MYDPTNALSATRAGYADDRCFNGFAFMDVVRNTAPGERIDLYVTQRRDEPAASFTQWGLVEPFRDCSHVTSEQKPTGTKNSCDVGQWYAAYQSLQNYLHGGKMWQMNMMCPKYDGNTGHSDATKWGMPYTSGFSSSVVHLRYSWFLSRAGQTRAPVKMYWYQFSLYDFDHTGASQWTQNIDKGIECAIVTGYYTWADSNGDPTTRVIQQRTAGDTRLGARWAYDGNMEPCGQTQGDACAAVCTAAADFFVCCFESLGFLKEFLNCLES